MHGYAENNCNLVLCRSCALQLVRKPSEDLYANWMVTVICIAAELVAGPSLRLPALQGGGADASAIDALRAARIMIVKSERERATMRVRKTLLLLSVTLPWRMASSPFQPTTIGAHTGEKST